MVKTTFFPTLNSDMLHVKSGEDAQMLLSKAQERGKQATCISETTLLLTDPKLYVPVKKTLSKAAVKAAVDVVLMPFFGLNELPEYRVAEHIAAVSEETQQFLIGKRKGAKREKESEAHRGVSIKGWTATEWHVRDYNRNHISKVKASRTDQKVQPLLFF